MPPTDWQCGRAPRQGAAIPLIMTLAADEHDRNASTALPATGPNKAPMLKHRSGGPLPSPRLCRSPVDPHRSFDFWRCRSIE